MRAQLGPISQRLFVFIQGKLIEKSAQGPNIYVGGLIIVLTGFCFVDSGSGESDNEVAAAAAPSPPSSPSDESPRMKRRIVDGVFLCFSKQFVCLGSLA